MGSSSHVIIQLSGYACSLRRLLGSRLDGVGGGDPYCESSGLLVGADTSSTACIFSGLLCISVVIMREMGLSVNSHVAVSSIEVEGWEVRRRQTTACPIGFSARRVAGRKQSL